MSRKISTTILPRIRTRLARNITGVLALLMLVFALVHLVRIDTLVPVVGGILPSALAVTFVILAVTAEVFALPYLLKMKLGRSERIISGLSVVLAPLLWTCLTLWGLGMPGSTGQFSSYLPIQATWWLLVLNLAWLGASYWVLWLTNFDKLFQPLRKRR